MPLRLGHTSRVRVRFRDLFPKSVANLFRQLSDARVARESPSPATSPRQTYLKKSDRALRVPLCDGTTRFVYCSSLRNPAILRLRRPAVPARHLRLRREGLQKHPHRFQPRLLGEAFCLCEFLHRLRTTVQDFRCAFVGGLLRPALPRYRQALRPHLLLPLRLLLDALLDRLDPLARERERVEHVGR